MTQRVLFRATLNPTSVHLVTSLAGGVGTNGSGYRGRYRLGLTACPSVSGSGCQREVIGHDASAWTQRRAEQRTRPGQAASGESNISFNDDFRGIALRRDRADGEID
jgi:hypothetical protein